MDSSNLLLFFVASFCMAISLVSAALSQSFASRPISQTESANQSSSSIGTMGDKSTVRSTTFEPSQIGTSTLYPNSTRDTSPSQSIASSSRGVISNGAAAGIAVAVAILLLGLAVSLTLILRRCRRHRQRRRNTEPPTRPKRATASSFTVADAPRNPHTPDAGWKDTAGTAFSMAPMLSPVVPAPQDPEIATLTTLAPSVSTISPSTRAQFLEDRRVILEAHIRPLPVPPAYRPLPKPHTPKNK
ncbi:hypothetical protein K438DRAFT_2020643 [Mycena galopus ATCC 62051]|nr:hypothetical protein K438DRAFT_2020643 [Mycena galopus ATCC 62051]